MVLKYFLFPRIAINARLAASQQRGLKIVIILDKFSETQIIGRDYVEFIL